MTAPFDPRAKYEVSASTTSTNTAISSTAPVLRVYNAGSVVVKLKWGSGSQTATTSDYTVCVAGGSTESFTKGAADNVAIITDSSTATVYLNVGVGP
jgi:hypothetical protein